MADSFFGFDTSLSNLNDNEGLEPSEDEYDALNDETFGQDSDTFDWEVEHEQLAGPREISHRFPHHDDNSSQLQLEASLCQLVLDEEPPPRTIGSSVWRHDAPFPAQQQPVQTLKNVCTVEELERQMRQKQQQQPPFQQNFFAPRFPVILQRPPGLQPGPGPFPPQQQMGPNMGPINKMIGPNNQMGQNNQFPTPMGQSVNQMGQSVNQMGQSVNQMGQSMNQMGQNVNQMGQNVNHFMTNSNQMGNFQNNQLGQNMMNMQSMPPVHQMGNQFPNQMSQMNHMNQMGQNVNPMNQMGQNVNQMGQNVNQMGQNVNQMGQNVNQMGQNVSQMGQNMNQMGQNQMMPNGNQFNHGVFPHSMNQPRLLGPPPGITMPRQNFNSTMGQFNSNFRGPSVQNKPPEKLIQQPYQQQQQQKKPQTNSPTNVANIKQSQVNQKDLKKSRVFNNTNHKDVSYQNIENIVQMIQNTHPMLQYNNSFHNANHHPMLNNRNFGNNNQFNNNNSFQNQRHNGAFNNSRHTVNGEEATSQTEDSYAGLMTAREKQWLVNIQLLQLSTGTPYVHDFYYTVFLERQANKEKEGIKEAHKANQQNHPFYSGSITMEPSNRSRHNSLRLNAGSEDAPRQYVPTQFENSLGKLQCGSVTAPRKIIDLEVVSGEPTTAMSSRAPSVASTTNPAEVPREMKRTKQLLLDIEALYLVLLRLEELNDPLAISNALILKEREEKQKQLEQTIKEALDQVEDESNVFLRNIESVQRRPKQDSPKSESVDKRQVVNLAVNQKPAPAKNLLDEDKEELMGKMFAGLLHQDRLAQMLAVRKGKALVCRFVRRVPPQHARLRALWARVLRALSSVARKDDGSLAGLAPHYARYIHSTSGWSTVLESCSLLAEALDPARTPYALMSSFTLSSVCALIDKASTLINTMDATANERQWSKFLKTLARALKNTTLNVAKPLKGMPEEKIVAHLHQLESRSTIEILKRGKAQEFADITKVDVMEQLIKYLC